MSSKKRHSYRVQPKSTKGERAYYKYFVYCCIILLVGIYLPQYYSIYYLEFSFLYLIVLPICFIAGLYFKYIKKLKKGLLYISFWATFCITFSLYTIVNVVYTNKVQNICSFESKIERAASSGYRSPASLFFKLDNEIVALIVRNEIPVKERLQRGDVVVISGLYKKGLLSSVMIVNYVIY